MTARPSAALLVLALAGHLAAGPQPPRSGLDLSDRSVRPQDDLYRFANGAWLQRTLPSDRVNYGAFPELADRTE